MDDKTALIIIMAINMLMWWLTLDYMCKTKRHEAEIFKLTEQYMKKNAAYWEFCVQNIGKMVDMDTESLRHFSEQIDAIMSKEGTKQDAEKNR